MASRILMRRPHLSTPAVRGPQNAHYSSIPSITQPAFWHALVPKPLRKGPSAVRKAKSTEWNPATFFIAIFLLIGSMSIQMIALRNEYAAFSRRADAKISLLNEIIEKVQKGEDVDVEGLLGSGDKEKEKEWEESEPYHTTMSFWTLTAVCYSLTRNRT